jgi:hypothetical protein
MFLLQATQTDAFRDITRRTSPAFPDGIHAQMPVPMTDLDDP